MNILDWLTLLSYVAINVDMTLQARRIFNTKSSKDLSLFGMTIRYIAIVIILIKFISLSSLPLILGQSLTLLTFSVYFVLAVNYFLHHRKQSNTKI